MDFISGSELLKLCEENHCRISDVMRQREASEFGADPEETISRMKEAYRIMKESCHKPLDEPVASIGGLIGGEAAKVRNRRRSGKSICGSKCFHGPYCGGAHSRKFRGAARAVACFGRRVFLR